nr:putative membrane protein [Emiliania huxleyi virus 86]
VSVVCQTTDTTKQVPTVVLYPCSTNNSYVSDNILSTWPFDESKSTEIVTTVFVALTAGLLICIGSAGVVYIRRQSKAYQHLQSTLSRRTLAAVPASRISA